MDEGDESWKKRSPYRGSCKRTILEGHSLNTVKASINQLEKANQVYKLGWDRIVSVASKLKENEDKTVYKVEIEKVLSKKAVCIINDKWRARLIPEEYNGPPNLIKKNVKFKAKGILYQEGKTLCIHVQRVTEVI